MCIRDRNIDKVWKISGETEECVPLADVKIGDILRKMCIRDRSFPKAERQMAV